MSGQVKSHSSSASARMYMAERSIPGAAYLHLSSPLNLASVSPKEHLPKNYSTVVPKHQTDRLVSVDRAFLGGAPVPLPTFLL